METVVNIYFFGNGHISFREKQTHNYGDGHSVSHGYWYDPLPNGIGVLIFPKKSAHSFLTEMNTPIFSCCLFSFKLLFLIVH